MATPDPILLDIPEEIVTPRLVLRCPRPGDGVAVHAAVLATLAQLRAWPASLPWAQDTPSPAASERWCRLARAEFILRQQLPWLILSRADGTLLGACGLHHPDWDEDSFAIGYWLHRAHWGHGYATEAVDALVGMAHRHLGMRYFTIDCDVRNLASARVAERAGFVLQGRQPLSWEEAGETGEILLYGRTLP
ncbi:GNAT family N-acetyltransferase [Chitiniphilus eburneus]|uniref:GNAT family N-acetyltransferase n=1 Tax=Chitiniphilus eburneus TaxID=2571148 RepID=A0A4U0PCY3_9NEIS|nr:GNAT family N-acetyltransferase [Chitiniphilus eburneus]TJZ65635.1 GNAT family N-acetyltransferase [Chitiniphilus eburneus]